MVGGGSFHLPHDLFRSTLLYRTTFSSPVTICFKNGTSSLCSSRQSHVEIWSRKVLGLFFFFCLTSVESKYQSNLITKLVQMIFLAWSGYFEYVPYLSHGTMLIFLNNVNVSIWLLSTSTGLPNCGTQSSKSTAWNFANHIWHVQSITTHSPYTAKIFFVFQLHFYLSWNNKT